MSNESYVDPQDLGRLSSKYTTILTDGATTLSLLCSIYQVNRDKLVSINTQKVNKESLPQEFQLYSNVNSVRDYLTLQYKDYQFLVKGLEVRIPQQVSGGKSETDIATTYDYETLSEIANQPVGNPVGADMFKSQSSRNTLTSEGFNQGRYRSLPRSWSSSFGSSQLSTTDSLSESKFGCYFYVLANNSVKSSSLSRQRNIKGKSLKVVPLPVYPQEFSDNNSANFSTISMLGRSVDYQNYTGSERSVSFTLNFHEELVPGNYQYISQVVSEIESACYPDYGSNGVVNPPEIAFIIGNHFYIKGVLSSTSASWKAPIINGRLVNCDLSVSVKETSGPYSMSEVAKMKGFRM